MHVAIIDGDVSYPATSGKRLRTLNLMLPLAKAHNVTYIARSQDSIKNRETATFLADHNVEPILVDAPIPEKRGSAFFARLAANLLSPLPYSVASHASAAMRRAVARHATTNPVDVWQLEWSAYDYCLAGQTAPVVLQAHNVDALIWQRYHEIEPDPLKRWYIAGQWRKFLKFEKRAFQAATRVVAVSQTDAALARAIYGELAIDVVDNGVDVAAFENVRPDPAARTILFLGALDWRPNLDSLKLLLDTIFPLVRIGAPDAKLKIVGRNPPAWLTQRVQRTHGAALSADVLDVRPYLASSSVMAVPLRVGGGSRLKILEALAAGLPVVSTSIGAEGLSLEAGRQLTLADTPESLAAALLQCLADPAAALEQAARGRKTVAERYDWEMLAGKLEEVWRRAAASKTRA